MAGAAGGAQGAGLMVGRIAGVYSIEIKVFSGYTLATLLGVARKSEIEVMRDLLRKIGVFGDYGSEGYRFDSCQVRHLSPTSYENSGTHLTPVCQHFVPISVHISHVNRVLGVFRNRQKQKETWDVDAV